MKSTVFAVLALLAMAGAFTEARELQGAIDWKALAEKALPLVQPVIPIVTPKVSVPVVKPSVAYQPVTVVIQKQPTPAMYASPKPSPKVAPAATPKPTYVAPKASPKASPYIAPVFVPSKCPEGLVLLKAIFMKTRAQIGAVLANGGVSVLDSAIANALFGDAIGNSAANAYNQNIGPAKAMSSAVAQAIKGDAQAAAAARATAYSGNTKAVSSALANALGGIAKATSSAIGYSIYGGNSATISSAQADAICAPAWADSTSNCATNLGGCLAVSQAVALAFKGNANANSKTFAGCDGIGKMGQPCSATGSAQALSVKGDASVASSTTGDNDGIVADVLAEQLKKLGTHLLG